MALQHSGVKGMRWGVINPEIQSHAEFIAIRNAAKSQGSARTQQIKKFQKVVKRTSPSTSTDSSTTTTSSTETKSKKGKGSGTGKAKAAASKRKAQKLARAKAAAATKLKLAKQKQALALAKAKAQAQAQAKAQAQQNQAIAAYRQQQVEMPVQISGVAFTTKNPETKQRLLEVARQAMLNIPSSIPDLFKELGLMK